MGALELMRRPLQATVEDPGVPLNSAEMVRLAGADSSWTGRQVGIGQAVTWVAMYSCVKVLAESLAELPRNVFERQERGRRKAFEHWMSPLVHDEANAEMTDYEWCEVGMFHLGFTGNFYCEIEWNGTMDRVLGFWPLRPDRTVPERRKGEIVYRTWVKDPGGREREVGLPSNRVFHVPGPGFDGLKGMHPLTVLRQAIGLGLGLEEYAARVFSNGGSPRILLRYPHSLQRDTVKQVRDELDMMWGGLDNAHRTAILEEGITFEKLSWSPEDVQALESRTHQLREVARFFRVPAHMVNDLERATFSNIEHQGLEFVQYTLGPWMVRWEKRLNRLLRYAARPTISTFYIKFNADGLLRGDFKSRMEGHQIAIQNGMENPDEAREVEEKNPREDGLGDRYWMPSNMMLAQGAATEPDGGAARRQRLREKDPTQAAERYRANYERLFTAAVKNLQAVEVRALERMLERAGGGGIVAIREEMERFYLAHERRAKTSFEPLTAGLAELLSFGAAAGSCRSNAMARRYVGASMTALLRAAAEPGNTLEALRREISGWGAARAQEFAVSETKQMLEELRGDDHV